VGYLHDRRSASLLPRRCTGEESTLGSVKNTSLVVSRGALVSSFPFYEMASSEGFSVRVGIRLPTGAPGVEGAPVSRRT
jgi:hypothetical protein